MASNPPRLLFITGRLAESALRRTLQGLSPQLPIDVHIEVLPITVIALASTPWIARHLNISESFDRIILPGLCQGDLEVLAQKYGCPVERGPKDLRDLPLHFGEKKQRPTDYGTHDIEILAEINHAPQLSLEQILTQARHYQQSGADLIDLGCDPGTEWTQVGDTVRALRQEGLRVSIDSFHPNEVQQAVKAGAELVLSVNSSNRERAIDWGCEVVVIPDDPATLHGFDETIEYLQSHNVPIRVDPILEPIGFGFAQSLGRYLEVRRRYPEIEIMMGIGNLTELTDVDSAGVNVTLLGFCQELGIRSVLTTEVINWCRSCVRELALARQLVYFACQQKTLPKHLEPDLLLLRDPRLRKVDEQTLSELSEQITDHNYRIIVAEDQLHVVNCDGHLVGEDPFSIFEQMFQHRDIDSSHAFYLGYEMCKAMIAKTLGKNYDQDQSLHWGFLKDSAKISKDSEVSNEENK